jgi:hypothetical protein
MELKGTIKVNKDVTWNPANDPSIVMGSRWDAIGGTNERSAAVLTYIRSSSGNTGAGGHASDGGRWPRPR